MSLESTIDLLTGVVDVFHNPQKRVFFGYLLSAGVIAIVWLVCRKGHSLPAALRTLFSKQSWWTASARIDYATMVLNALMMSVITPRLIGQSAVAILVFELLHELLNGRPVLLSAPGWVIAGSFTLTLFIVDDFARFFVHRLLHRVSFLWAFHKVHHGATSLNPMTVFRTHPVEGILFVLRGALVQGTCVAVFFFFFGSQVSLFTVLGAGLFNFAFNALGSNLRHSHISIGFWKPLELIFISPAQHQIHHSKSAHHHDKNFGVALAIWDVLFGSHCYSQPDEKLEFGLLGDDEQNTQNLARIYLQPFVEAAGSIARQPLARARN